MAQIFSSSRLDWSNAIGLFLINFGTLDLHVLHFLRSELSGEEFAKVKQKPFHERMSLCKSKLHAAQPPIVPIEESESFFNRLEPIRALRNHIAHGTMRFGQTADKTGFEATLTLPRDLTETNDSEARHLTFRELANALGVLDKLIEEFDKVAGIRVTTEEINLPPKQP